MTIFERYVCSNPVCEGKEIFPPNVASNIDRQTGIRTLRVRCPSCEKIFEGKFALRGSAWCLVGAIEEITDKKRVASLNAYFDTLSRKSATAAMSA